MGNGSGIAGRKLGLVEHGPSGVPSGHGGGSFIPLAPDFEKLFLDLLSTDIRIAAGYLPRLKRGLSSLPALDKARRERLVARYYEARSDHRRALRWTSRALRGFRDLDYQVGVFQCTRMLFTAYVHLGQYEKARDFAMEMLRNPQLPAQEQLKIQTNLGALEYRNHNYPQALVHFKTALKILKKHENEELLAIVSYNLGNLNVCLNRFDEAELHIKKAHLLFEKANLLLYQAHALQAYGYLYTILDQYFHAETKINEAKRLYSEGGDQLGALLCDLELLRMELKQNRFERVLQRMPGLTAAFGNLGRSTELGMVDLVGAQACLGLGDYGEAEEYLAAAGRIFRAEGNHHDLAQATMLEGILLARRKCEDEGLMKIEAAGREFAKVRAHERELECLIHYYQIRAQAPEVADMRRIRALLTHPLSPWIRTQALILTANYWRSRGQVKRAVRCLLSAVNAIEETRASISSSRTRGIFFIDKACIYEALIELLFGWRNASGARLILRVIELSRGRGMSELISHKEHLPPILNREEPKLLAFQKLATRLKQLNRRLEDLSDRGEAMETERAHVLAAIEVAHQGLAGLKAEMENEERLGHFFPIDLSDRALRELLAPDEMLVFYFLAEGDLYRLEMDRDGLRTYRHGLTTEFHRDFNRLMAILGNRIQPKFAEALACADRLSAILAPRKRKRIRHYTFIPHKSIQQFPLSMLRRNGRFLIERHTLSQAPNLAALYFALRKSAGCRERPVFFFSDQADDPCAPERVALAKCYPNARSYARFEGSNLWQQVAKSDLIHFAGHCYFDKNRPKKSYLQLAGKRIYLGRFARLRLVNQPLINLAACRSGRLTVGAGNEPSGFAISALAAGAATVLASLWDIDDEATGAWMEVFYDHLDQGPAEAFRQACLALMAANGEFYAWAGFCLIGKH